MLFIVALRVVPFKPLYIVCFSEYHILAIISFVKRQQ